MSRKMTPDREKLKGRAAPPSLEFVRAFVNTRYGRKHNEIVTSDQLRMWLVRHGLLDKDAPVTDGDLRRALETREAIRGLLRANNGVPLDTESISALNNAGRNAPLVARFDNGGRGRLKPDIAGVDGVLGLILSIVVVSMANGTWARLKACRNDPCQFAFFDRSKNHSGVWCAMTCGNRINARVYRQRRRKERSPRSGRPKGNLAQRTL
jgi:predicted RNA-binding Zn ribbon-like protein